MAGKKPPQSFLITPNYPAPFDQRMVNGLAEGFRVLGHAAHALPSPVSAEQLASACRELSIDVVIQVNRTRSQEFPLPPKVRHVAWFQDVFPETSIGFAEKFHPSDILYALGDPLVLGLDTAVPCLVGSLVTGVDQAVLDYRQRGSPDSVDFSLCGFIPRPGIADLVVTETGSRRRDGRSFDQLSALEILGRGSLAEVTRAAPSLLVHLFSPLHISLGEYLRMSKVVRDNYQPLRGNLDIKALAAALRAADVGPDKEGSTAFEIAANIADRLRNTGLPRLRPRENAISYLARDYPRMLDRVALVKSILEVSNSLLLHGIGWGAYPAFRPYAKGNIENLDLLLDTYCRSRINLANNTHGLGLHSRTLECMAVGGFIFIHESPHDDKPGGMLSAFEPGRHYGSYTPMTIQDEAKRWLRDDEARMQAGQQAKAVIREAHCWHHRAQQILYDLAR